MSPFENIRVTRPSQS